jgi:hypothetical protein
MLSAILLATPAAWADATVRLADVQKAYAEVDYESTRRLAKAALERGGNDRASTAELYLLWGTAAAALDQADEARVAFLYVLAINPEAKLERSLSPKIRAPYLEARGSMSQADGKPPLGLGLQRHQQELEVTLTDSAHVVARVEVATRAHPDEPFARRRLEAVPRKRVPTPNGAELDFFLQALDRHANVLFELGNQDAPEHLAFVSSRPVPAAAAAHGPDVNRTPYYITAGALAGLGVAAGGIATAQYLRREDAARDWNSSDCEQPGRTREQQCGNVDTRRQHAESRAIGFATTSGALLLGSVVTLILTPSNPAKASVAVDATPGTLMFRLRTTL